MPTREIPPVVTEAVQTARTWQNDGDALIDKAARLLRDTAKQLARDGWTQIEIGAALGVSKQRVSQLVNPPKRPAGK